MAAPVRTLIVEGTPQDEAIELARYIQALDSSLSVEQSVEKFIDAGDLKSASEELLAVVHEIYKAPDNEIESAFNLLISIIDSMEDRDSLIKKLIDQITPPSNKPSARKVAVLVLSTQFNIIPVDSRLRPLILDRIVQYSIEYGFADHFKNEIENISRWLKDCKASDEEQRSIYTKLASFFLKKDSESAFAYLNLVLRTLSAEEVEKNPEFASKQILRALSIPELFEFDSMLSSPAIHVLRAQNDPAYQLLQIFLRGGSAEFEIFLEKNKEWAKQNEVDGELLSQKIRLLAFASAAAAAPDRQLTHQQIQNELNLAPSQVEPMIIDVIRAGLVEGKISQSQQKFMVHRSTVRLFEKEHWQSIKVGLDEWRSSLQNILQKISTTQNKTERQKSK